MYNLAYSESIMFCDVICPTALEITIPTFDSDHTAKNFEFFLEDEIDLGHRKIYQMESRKRINMLSVESSILMGPPWIVINIKIVS